MTPAARPLAILAAILVPVSLFAAGMDSIGNVDGVLTWHLGDIPVGESRSRTAILAWDADLEALVSRLQRVRKEADLPADGRPAAKQAGDVIWISSGVTDFALNDAGSFYWEGRRQALACPAGGQLSRFGYFAHYTSGEPRRAGTIIARGDRAEENLRHASIRSPIDGIVLSRELEVGDAVSSILQLGSNATLIMTLGDTRELYVKGKVDETDIGLVRVGMPVRVTVDAYKNRIFRGKVLRIAPMGVEKDNVTRFEVRVSILDDLELLKVNMSANAEIILEEHHDARVIPESALIYNEKRETFVEVPDPSSSTGRRLVPVRTGLSNGARTEVLAGLKQGDRVVLQ